MLKTLVALRIDLGDKYLILLLAFRIDWELSIEYFKYLVFQTQLVSGKPFPLVLSLCYPEKKQQVVMTCVCPRESEYWENLRGKRDATACPKAESQGSVHIRPESLHPGSLSVFTQCQGFPGSLGGAAA